MFLYHFYHSGVCCETENYQLFFDCITDVKPFVKTEKTSVFFISHGHSDHYSPDVFGNEGVFVVSDDCDLKLRPAHLLMVKPNETYPLMGLEIRTYASTDLGVAFLVKADDQIVFHAGDLNWWHWSNDSTTNQKAEEKMFKDIVKGIHVNSIDVAFIPVDPRLGEAAFYAAKHMDAVFKIHTIVPIHFRSDFYITEALNQMIKQAKVIQKTNEVL